MNKTQEQEQEIISILRENGIGQKTIRFSEANDYNDIYGMYIWRKKVCVLSGGFDIDFDELTPEQRQTALDRVKSMKWKIDNTI